MSNPAEKHTPGPWEQPYPWQVRLGPCQDPETPKCSVVVDLPLGHIADARLIARAPELLAALRNMVSRFDSEIHNEYDGTSTLRERLAEIDHVRTLVREAEGGAA